MAGPLRKFFLKLQPAIKLGGGGKALTARLLREELFFAASLRIVGVGRYLHYRNNTENKLSCSAASPPH